MLPVSPSSSIPLYREFIYAYANGRVWVLENKLIDREKLLRIAEAGSVDDVVKLLSETEYSELQKSTANIDEVLEKTAPGFYAFLSSFFPDKEIINAFLTRYQLYNKKKISRFKEEEIESKLIEIDKEIINEKLKLSKKIKKFNEILKIEIDLINLKILLRAQAAGKNLNFLEKALFEEGNIKKARFLTNFNENIDKITNEISLDLEKIYGEEHKELPKMYLSSPADFDRECDNLILEKAKALRKILLGPESLIAYIYEKENEIKNLGIILRGKLSGLGIEEIKKMLRG